jgi:nitroreductase
MSEGSPVYKTILERTSVRSFSTGEVPPQALADLQRGAAAMGAGPFGSAVRFIFLQPSGSGAAVRVGTYGLIAGRPAYVVCAAPREGRPEDVGFLFEELILHATALGLGTCWLGGTFDRAGLSDAVPLAEGEYIPAICPIGAPARRRGIKETVMRAAIRADGRKPWDMLFFREHAGTVLSREDAGPCADALEAVRRAPSASNRQPWRVIRAGSTYRFLLSRTPGYGTALGFDIQRVDMGIAMHHFDAVTRAAGLAGTWAREPPDAIEGDLVPVARWSGA